MNNADICVGNILLNHRFICLIQNQTDILKSWQYCAGTWRHQSPSSVYFLIWMTLCLTSATGFSCAAWKPLSSLHFPGRPAPGVNRCLFEYMTMEIKSSQLLLAETFAWRAPLSPEQSRYFTSWGVPQLSPSRAGSLLPQCVRVCVCVVSPPYHFIHERFTHSRFGWVDHSCSVFLVWWLLSFLFKHN